LDASSSTYSKAGNELDDVFTRAEELGLFDDEDTDKTGGSAKKKNKKKGKK